LLVTAIVGGAALTPLMGVISDAALRIRYAYGVSLVGYLVIAGYALLGQSVETKRRRRWRPIAPFGVQPLPS